MEEKKEFEKQLEDQQKQLEEKQNELEKTKKQLEIKTKLAVKKWYDQEPGHVIYGFRSTVVIENENKQLITIGKSKNVAKRESSYMTHNQHGEMFYIRKCYNCDLAEKVLHHMLDKFREERNKEWFHISEELTTYAIDTVCDFLDIFINCSEKLPEYKIKEFMNKLPINRFDTTLKLLKTEDLYIPDVIFNKNTKDFNTFFNECCEKDEMNTSDVLIYEVTGAYRIWCKQSLSREMLSEFKTYINTHFTFKEKYFANTGIRHKIITNLKLKELKMTPDDKYNIKTYERFCLELCVCNYTYKIKITDFMENYTLWMKKQYPEYEMSNKEFLEMKEYFKRKFTLDNSMIYGIQLQTDKLPNIRKREFCKIFMINEHKEILNVYNGLSEIAEKLKLDIKAISDIIRYTKVIEYDNEKIILVYDKDENVVKKRNVEIKPIYKYNFDTKQLLQTFYSTRDVSTNLEITTSTVLRYINIAKVFISKKDGNSQIVLSYLDNIHNIKPVEKTKVVKSRPRKKLYVYYYDTNNLFIEYDGPYDAANKLNIGQCTVHRHINNKKPLTIMYNNQKISILFSYTNLHHSTSS